MVFVNAPERAKRPTAKKYGLTASSTIKERAMMSNETPLLT